jgi:hypothetical protein
MILGSDFSTTGGLKNYMRASFSMIAPEQVEAFSQRYERNRNFIFMVTDVFVISNFTMG